MTAPAPRVALVPWGTPLEVFLDPLGRTLDDFCDRLTGGWLFGYAAALASAGYAPTLVVSSRSTTTRSTRTHLPTGTPVTVLPAPAQSPPRPPGLRRNLGAYRRALPPGLLRELAGHDVVLLQEYEEPRADLLAWWGRIRGVPVAASFQGGVPPWERAPVERLLRAPSLRRLAALLVGSRAEAERLVAERRVDAARVFSVVNPVDVDAWSPGDRGAARSELGLPKDAFVVAWHGRVDLRRKGLDVLVEAWSALCSRRPDADLRLLLVGTGPDETALRTLLDRSAARGVAWLDRYAPPAEVRQRLAACDVWVSPSRHEGFAVAPLEAMASGRPVVVTDVPGAEEMIGRSAEHGGLLVPRDDAAALSGAMHLLSGLSGDDLAGSGRRARRRVEDVFSVAAVGRQLDAALRATTATASRSGGQAG